MNALLNKIRVSTLERVHALDMRKLESEISLSRTPKNFLDLFHSSGDRLRIIAEIKFASPSLGTIHNETHNPLSIAKDYLTNGAAALSILTEPHFFNGNIEFLKSVRQRYPSSYLLMKDFILHEVQLRQARVYGADAILLIASFLQPKELSELYQKAIVLGLTPLVEVHSQKELEIALELNPLLIGINNRNLNSLSIDLNISRDLISLVPENTYVISESGLHSGQELNEMVHLGFDGFLIGTSLMKTKMPGITLKQLIVDFQKNILGRTNSHTKDTSPSQNAFLEGYANEN